MENNVLRAAFYIKWAYQSLSPNVEVLSTMDRGVEVAEIRIATFRMAIGQLADGTVLMEIAHGIITLVDSQHVSVPTIDAAQKIILDFIEASVVPELNRLAEVRYDW